MALNDYTTAQIGNASLTWIQSVVEAGPDHPPFFAWLGPHAPHKASTPAAWYAEHPVGNLPLVKGASWNYLGADKHDPLSVEPVISAEDEASIVQEQAYRLRTLLSVDDLVQGLHEYLVAVGEWDRTYWLYTSDHGYNLGQFRVDSDKTQAYDHVIRVPFLVKGPGIAPGQVLPHTASMADVAPTILELIGGLGSNAMQRVTMDGTSWAPILLAKPAESRSPQDQILGAGWPRTATIVEYQPGRKANSCSTGTVISPPGALPARAYNISCHYHDGPNNTFAALRIIAPQTGDLMYAEFVDGTDPNSYYFAPEKINFRELYNISNDYYQLYNIAEHPATPKSLLDLLHDRLHLALVCKGSAACNGALSFL